MPDDEREKYILEPVHDQANIAWATVYMKRKIKAVIAACKDCTTTDKFIAASVGQGSGFTPQNMTEVSNPKVKDIQYLYVIPENKRINDVAIDWEKYFKQRDNPRATSGEVNRFNIAVDGLVDRNWALPDESINFNYISLID